MIFHFIQETETQICGRVIELLDEETSLVFAKYLITV